MYGHFRMYNSKSNTRREASANSPWWMKDIMSKQVRDWRDICMQDIEVYEKEFCKDKSLKSEIGVE